jgi:hypothetical protein
MKELRPGSAGSTEVRILFCFDPRRQAILLVAGDKSGQWQDWYKRAIPRWQNCGTSAGWQASTARRGREGYGNRPQLA